MYSMTRKEQREAVFQLLFEREFRKDESAEEIFALSSDNREIDVLKDKYIKNTYFGVVENEEKNIIPNGKNADYIINSFLPYELAVIKHYLLNTISYDMTKSCERDLFETIIKEFQNIPIIPSELVPQDSVFREFIGK